MASYQGPGGNAMFKKVHSTDHDTDNKGRFTPNLQHGRFAALPSPLVFSVLSHLHCMKAAQQSTTRVFHRSKPWCEKALRLGEALCFQTRGLKHLKQAALFSLRDVQSKSCSHTTYNLEESFTFCSLKNRISQFCIYIYSYHNGLVLCVADKYKSEVGY